VKVSRRRAFRILLTCAPLVRASSEEALEVYAHKLDLPESVKREALAILREVRPYAGGRDPYLVALAAIYLASGAFTIYGLAKAAGRSPGRLHDNVRFLQAILARKARA
jgi:transcription initiation factor TFIIIB Brf1 subunit/transcription initiation factor TFIIB